MAANSLASGNWNAAGNWDPQNTPFSEDELEDALRLRQSVTPDLRRPDRRSDFCPHPRKCDSLDDCVRFIAWYLRHRHVLEKI